jgi:hypothetical protein
MAIATQNAQSNSFKFNVFIVSLHFIFSCNSQCALPSAGIFSFDFFHARTYVAVHGRSYHRCVAYFAVMIRVIGTLVEIWPEAPDTFKV